MDKIVIHDLVARGIIGVNPDEREKPQEIVINIVLDVDTSQVAVTDNLEDTVNYSSIAKKILNHAETAQRFTVEALAGDIANICLSEEKVHKVCVRVEKPCAVRFARSVGVVIERSRTTKR